MTAYRRLRFLRNPIRPSDADDAVAVEFDRQLDAWVTGTPAPEPVATSTASDRARLDRLTSTFRQAAAMDTAGRERAESTSGHAATQQDIWEDIMSATTAKIPRSSRPSGPFEDTPWMEQRVEGSLPHAVPPRKRSGARGAWMPHLSPVLNVAMVAIMLLTLGLGAFVVTGGSDRWGIGGNGNDPGPGVNGLASLPAGLQGTPVATGDLPTASECTVTPLTVDQVMDRIKGTSSYPSVEMATKAAAGSTGTGAAPTVASVQGNARLNNGETPVAMATPAQTGPQRPSAEMLAEITAAHRQFVACVLKGDQFQVWALIDPESVYWRNFLNTYPPFTDEATVRADMEALADGSAGLDSLIPNVTNMLLIDRYLPTVNPDPDASLLKYDLTTENGILRVVIVGMIYHYPDGTARAIPREEMATNWVYTWNQETNSWMVTVIGLDANRG
ncbi:MAG TPA: hypothetical protein VNZ55_08905 [Thermomicrobiales bacterium]|nr:hypothetical protein [Thermomicrobiales bacterium]